jgi:phospholipid/cholesterol/gamma-HCH transport system ATP-binding protein
MAQARAAQPRFRGPHAEVLAIVGASGCGKSTLLRHMIGLQAPAAGRVCYGDEDINSDDAQVQARLRRRFGVAFQSGALWSSMTVGENVMLPLEIFARTAPREREQQARAKLALVDLADQFDTEPAALSGGMRKRAAIARALALDPALLYLDEPSAGLDPLISAQLDELILRLCKDHGTTVVMVSHELPSIFSVADRLLFLDADEKTMTALDSPQALLDLAGDGAALPARARRHEAPRQRHPDRRLRRRGPGAVAGRRDRRRRRPAVRPQGAHRHELQRLDLRLQLGAPVVFRGVRVGSVRSVGLLYDKGSGDYLIPVWADLESRSLRGLAENGDDGMAALSSLVGRGLTAQLSIQSLLTGQLYIDLDLRPQRQAVRSSTTSDDALEIPTSATTIQNLTKQLDEVDIRRLLDDVSAIAESARTVLAGPS